MKKYSVTSLLIFFILMLSTAQFNQAQVTPDLIKSESITYFETPIIDPILNADSVNLTILHINDWHGWLEPHDGRGGAATYSAYFQQEGYTSSENSSFLLLSGGDHNTGPAVATLTQGEAMIDVMNAMNFSAAAIGNHEFDYGIEKMNYRQSIANFPLLSCNILNVGSTELANFTIPWVIQEHAGIQVGIVGLTTIASYTSAHPKYTQYYDFDNYEFALRNNVPEMIAAGAEVIIALTHCTPTELTYLAEDVADLNISVFLGGHAGGGVVKTVNNSIVAAAGHYAEEYVRIDLEIDLDALPIGVSAKSGYRVANVEGGVTPDADIQQLVDYWVDFVNADTVISTASINVYDTTPESGIANLVADGMLDCFDWTHDFSITNRGGGIRDYFRAGDVTVGDVVSVIPFENEILEMTISGADLFNIIEAGHGYQIYGNIRYNFSNNGGFNIDKVYINMSGTFEELVPGNAYTGLIIDYTWWVVYKDTYPATQTGEMYRDAAIAYISKIADISRIAYDGRIQEDAIIVPELSPNYLLLFIAPSVIVVSILLKRKQSIVRNLKP